MPRVSGPVQIVYCVDDTVYNEQTPHSPLFCITCNTQFWHNLNGYAASVSTSAAHVRHVSHIRTIFMHHRESVLFHLRMSPSRRCRTVS